MISDEQDGATIEIDDDIWDVVDAMIAMTCEINGEAYFTEHHVSPKGSFQSIQDFDNCDSNSILTHSGTLSLRATTNAIILRIVEAVSEKFQAPSHQTSSDAHECVETVSEKNHGPSYQTSRDTYELQSSRVEAVSEKIHESHNHSLRDAQELLSTSGMLSLDFDTCFPNGQFLGSGAIMTTQQSSSLSKIEQYQSARLEPEEISVQIDGSQSKSENGYRSPESVVSESKFGAPSSDICSKLIETPFSSVNDPLRTSCMVNIGESSDLPSTYGDTNKLLHFTSVNNFNHATIETGKTAMRKLHFVCENDSFYKRSDTLLLLDFANSSSKSTKTQNLASSCHSDLHKVAVRIRFSCFQNDKQATPLFTGLSLLHILSSNKDEFDTSVYDDLNDMGCKPDEESTNGCNVFAFAACQGNFLAMRHISLKHSSILKSTLCKCQNADRNILHCIMDFAAPSYYDSIFELLGPSICTDLCAQLKGASDSPVFIALKYGNYTFLQSISKQVYIWNLTSADFGDAQTFLSTIMSNPLAHRFLLRMLSSITSLESFVVQSTIGTRDLSMMCKVYQMGHMNIVTHVLKQQSLLYFSELDKIESFATQIDTNMTRTNLFLCLSKLFENHRSNTVVLWHCIHLVTSLSHDEEMALDLLSTANLDGVKNHRDWRSFDRYTGESALHIAAQKEWTEVLSCLCDLGHDVNPFCFMMRTPMHTAALHNCAKSIMLLNNLGAEVSIESGDGKTPIAFSIETKNIECSMEILSNVGSRKSLFRTDFKGLSPLMRALESQQLQVAHKILKQHPEQANFVSMNGTNIFHAAAPHLASVQQLVSWSSQERKDIWAFLQQKNNDGETPKDIAAHCGYLDSLRFFLQIYQSKGFTNNLKSLQEMDVNYSESKDAFSQTDFSSPSSVQKFLSDHSEAMNSYDFYHRTPLILAVKARNLQSAQDLVDAGVDILRTDTLGNSAMHYMYFSKKEQSLWMWEEPSTSETDPSDVIQCIIQRNSEDIVAKCLTLKNKAGITPFCLAVMNEFYVDVALLCGEVKFPKSLLNVQLPNGTYCLHIACSKNLISLAILFLNLGSDPSVFDSNGMSPEYIARSHGHNSITLILMQFSNAMKIQCAIRSYLSRVHALSHRADCIAVQNVLFKLIENPSTLMQHYTDLRVHFPRANWNAIEHPKHSDVVPIAYAAMCNNSQALKFILDLKMDPNIRGKISGSSPLAFAVERGSTESIKLLLAAAADVNNCDNRKRTPVHCAAEKGFLGSLKILGEFHPNYNALDENQCTPTMLSLTSGSFLTSKPLIQYSSETMNVPSLPSGNTPLLEAISRSADMDVIKAILTHGGEVLVTNNDGQTALSISIAMGNAVLEFIFRELLVWCNGYRELRSLSMEERAFFIDVIFEVAEIFESSGNVSDRNSKIQDLTRMASKNHRFTSIEWLLSPSTGGLEFLDISSCLLMACDSPAENLPIIVALIKFRKKCAMRRPILEYVDEEGRSILHICAMLGHANTLTLLIDEIHAERSVCIFDMQDACGRSPFFLACQAGHIEVVKNLMQYSEVNLHMGDATGGRPIVAALINRHLDVVASILEVDPTLALDVSNNGTSILHIIAASDEYLPLAIRVMSIPNGRSLLGCARHTLTENGTVESSLPIDIAVKYDAIKMISHLRKMSMSLQEKKVLNLQTQIAAKMAESPALLTAEAAKNPKIIFTRDSLHRKNQAVLLQNNVRCYFARLTLARHRAKFLLYCRRMLEAIIADDVQAVNYILREWPALIRINLKDGLSALYLSCENAAAAVLDYLLANGIDANQVNQRNRNCLHYAVLSTVAPFVRKIAALQVSHSLQDHQGNTPLHLACINGDSAVADELLYLNSAPLSVENKEKLNPDEVAIINGHDALARKLVETKKHSSAQWDDFGSANIKFSSKVEADWISIRQKAIRRKAATQLQCVYRSYASRNILRLLTMKYHFRNQAAILIKLNIKSAVARNRFFLNTQANILQRNWILHKSRILCIVLKQQKRIYHAQIRICYAVKMNAYRSKYKPQQAAATIQRVFLGHVSRKPYKDFVDKVHVRKRNFFSQRLQSAYRQHMARKIMKIEKTFVFLSSIFSRFVTFRKFGPQVQFLSLRRWAQHFTRCAKAFLQRRNYGVKIGNLTSLRYYSTQIVRIQRAYSSHKHVSRFRSVHEMHLLDVFRLKRHTAASLISNSWRAFKSRRCLKLKVDDSVSSKVYLLQFYVFNKLETELSSRLIQNASSKIANMYRFHLAKARVHHLKGEPMRLELLHIKSTCVSIISRSFRCFLAKSTLKILLHNFKIKCITNAALCIFGGWRCWNARNCKRKLSIAAHLEKIKWASTIVKKFIKVHAKNYKGVWKSYVMKRSVTCLSSYVAALIVRTSLYRNAMITVIQRSWHCHRARLLTRNLHLRRVQGLSNPRLSGKGKRHGTGSGHLMASSLHLTDEKSKSSRRKTSASQRAITKSSECNILQGDVMPTADADENIAICESEYDLEDKAYIFSRYLAEGKPGMKRSDSVPLPALEPHWKEFRSSSRPSSSASVRHYISYTVPGELGLGIEHRGNIKRLLEAKSYGENDFFPAPRVDYAVDKHLSKRPFSSSSSRASSRPTSSITTTAVEFMAPALAKFPTAQSTSLRSVVARPVWLKMIILTGAASLHSKIESPFQAAAFENAVRKKNPQLALQIAESNLTTAKSSQSQEQYDAYILALVSFAVIEAIKTVPDKSDSSSLILLQIADETIRTRGQHLEDKNLLRVWCHDALSMYYYFRNKYHAAEEAVIKAIRCVDHRLSNENHCILLQHAALIRLRNGKPKEAESSARRAIRIVYSSFDPDVSSDAEASIHLPPIHSLGLVGSLLNFCFILYKTAQGSKAVTSLNVSIHLLQEMMPFQSTEAVQLMSLASCIGMSM